MTNFIPILFFFVIVFKNYSNTWADTFKFCNGSNQSPVALDACKNSVLPSLNFIGHSDIRPELFTLHNDGYTAQIIYQGEAPTITYGPLKGIYKLHKIHFHWGIFEEGSEHQINGIFYGMEAHLVHFKEEYGSFQNALNFQDGVAVVALMFEDVITNNDDLIHIVSNLHLIHIVNNTAILPRDSMTWLAQYLESPGRSYFTYFGSLTTSPCNEVVTWIVLSNVASVGRQQIAQFRRLNYDFLGTPILENRRPLQPLNSREVICSL